MTFITHAFRLMRGTFVVLLITIPVLSLKAQLSGLDTIRINEVILSYKIPPGAMGYIDSSKFMDAVELSRLPFNTSHKPPVAGKIGPSLVQKYIYLKFIVKNAADTTITCHFLPGYYYEQIDLYKLASSGTLPQQLPSAINEPFGYRSITLEANQPAVFFARLKLVRTTVNTLEPSLIRQYYLDPFIAINKNKARDINIMTFVFTGILLVMIFYSLAVYLMNNNIEFVYYSGYAFCLGLMLFLKSYLFRTPSPFNYFFESYLDFIMQCVGTLIYLSFLRIFIDTKKNFPFLNKMLIAEQFLMIVSMILFSYLYFQTDQYVLQALVENLTKYMWSLSTIIFIVYTIYIRNKFLNYLAIGHFFLLIGGLCSLYMMQSSPAFRKSLPEVLNSSLFYYELGLTIELVFFLAALAFKNKNDIVERTKERERLKLRNERQEFEKQLAVFSAQQEERNRISEDMHDELGSGVTAIRLMSEIVKTKMKENTLPEINKISNSANDLINKMNTLIWTMKSENDSLESLITYIRIYALEYFENTSIDCTLHIPDHVPAIELSGEKRRNIFLSVKESLTNVLKHSSGTMVQISFEIDKSLVIRITDNGVGIEPEKLRQFGNGLKNIGKRMIGIGGRYSIRKSDEGGTLSVFEVTV